MKPIYKWTGGKRREIKVFEKYFPKFVLEKKDYLYIEPFFGGGAVYWYLENEKNIINDIDFDLINFLNKIKEKDDETITNIITCSNEIQKVNNILDLDIKKTKELRGEIYYRWRNLDRMGLDKINLSIRAARFFIVNQLSFNGMRRFNSKGGFNVPYGNYKNLNYDSIISKEHINLLKNTKISNKDFRQIITENDSDNTFIFLDPPYTRIFNEYSADNVFGRDEHEEMANLIKSTKNADILLVINKDDFTTNLYMDYIIDTYKLRYSTNIKNRFAGDVEHLIITNKKAI